MPKDAKGNEVKRGDEVTLRGRVEHTHEQMVSVRLLSPSGAQYEPVVTISPELVEKPRTDQKEE